MTDRTLVLRLTPQLKIRLGLVAMGLFLLLITSFYLGRQNGLGEAVELKVRSRELAQQVNRQAIELKAKQAELVRVNKAAEIDRLAAESVRKDILTYQQEAAELQRDVEFYRGLMAPDELQRGLKLHAFNLDYDELSGRYTFNGVLTNAGGRGNVVKGSLTLALNVYDEHGSRRVALAELPEYEGKMPIKLRFRFFQNIEGSFTLPDGMQPESVIASADVKDASGQLFRVVYDWEELSARP